MFKKIKNDIKVVFNRDPAAKNVLEVIFCYSGLHALWLYRIAHWFYKKREYMTARLISQFARFLTGIEIHPGAKLGPGFFVDHGSGVVIGETSEVGSNCLIYQGVVLGGTSLRKEKRHPTLKDEVVVGAGAVILGPVTIGNKARIGAGAVVINDIPDGATATGIPARVVSGYSEKIKALEHANLPDPVADAVNYMIKRQSELISRVEHLESLEGVKSNINRFMEDKKKEILNEFSNMVKQYKGENKNENKNN
jgi:serine O-acetyltransferase